jgi:arylformamidase
VEVIDITVPVRPGMPVYPGDPAVRMELAAAIARGDAYNVTRLDLGVHTGTHVDAPAHVIDGAPGVDALPLDALVGPAEVVDFPGHIPAAARVLLRTAGSGMTLAPADAEALVARGVLLVGIDGPTIGEEHAHATLLGAGVVVLEGLDLRAVEPGEWELLCLPLKLTGADGAPARVLLRRPARVPGE